jgi:hypothetical protein
LRTVSGVLIGAGHLIFAALFAQVLRRMGPPQEGIGTP